MILGISVVAFLLTTAVVAYRLWLVAYAPDRRLLNNHLRRWALFASGQSGDGIGNGYRALSRLCCCGLGDIPPRD